ncbi:hypothetical protein F2Q70_00008497 [Brassica cretica]|uniref:Uncharacterized protein n=1 Tax=Brassica cretica TaxID=69181 RepID=A0A8S9J8Z2_BRACR|nr:hypothetical protein F2Q68_00000836 [Brassica cretica]KAF2609583.1 hypothetical protein F2Q70_00008497 [Brassica cretica]
MKAAVVTGKSSPEVNRELRYVNAATMYPPYFSLREIGISQHDELQATTAISDLRSTFVVLIHLQAMLKLDPQIVLRKRPAPT